MIAETKLAIADQPRMSVKELLEVQCRKFYLFYANIEAHGHMGSCPGYALLIWQGRATKPREDGFWERVGRIIERNLASEARMERTLAGEARMKTYKDRIAERKASPREELELSEVQEMCLRNAGIQIMSRWRVRHADASAGYIKENQHEEKRKRGIRVNKRRPGATSEEYLDEWRKTERLEHEAPNTSASSDPCVARECTVSCEIQRRPGSVLVQKSGRVDDDVRIAALDAVYGKDGRRSRYIGEVLKRYRGEDAGDLKIIELVEKWTRLNVLEKENLEK